jgi:hypothetical protein
MAIAELWVTATPPFNIVPDGTQGTGAHHEVEVANGKRLVYIRGYRHVAQNVQRAQTVTDSIFIHNRRVDWAEAYPAGFGFGYTTNDQHIRALRIDARITFISPHDDIGNRYTEIHVESIYDMEDDQGNPYQAAVAVIIVALTSEWV